MDVQHNYDDIINLPHHESNTHKPMSIYNRAAQFASFAALSGYGEAVEETHRLTNSRIELDEEEKCILDRKIQFIQSSSCNDKKTIITFFVPDSRKEGGSYFNAYGTIKKVDMYNRSIIMDDQTSIPIDEIIDISIDETMID